MSVVLHVPKRCHSEIIGRGGETILEIQDSTGAKIRVPSHDSGSDEVIVEGEPDQIAAAQKAISKAVGFEVGTELLVVLELNIPPKWYGMLIGPHGSTLKGIESQSGCNIEIPGRNSDTTIVKIEGPANGLITAQKCIQELTGGIFEVVAESAFPIIERERLPLTGPSISESLFFPDPTETSIQRFLVYLGSPLKKCDVCVFTITDDRIARVLLDLHREGVKVRVITDNDTNTAEGSDIASIKAGGIPVRMDRSPGCMHHKFAILDRTVLMNGSFNWTRGASQVNNENVMVTNAAEFVCEFQIHFDKLWDQFA